MLPFAEVMLVGVATWYGGVYVDGPLYCGGTYAPETDPWVALDVALEGAFWECGDLVHLRFDDGTSLTARAMDAGPFERYRVGEERIVVDVPEHLAPFAGLSSGVEVLNLSAMARQVKTER